MRNLLAFLSFLTIFLLNGCLQEPIELKDKDLAEQVEESNSSNSSNSEERTADTPPSKEKSKKQNSENRKEAPNNLSQLNVHYINVGQADSTLFQYSQGGEEYTILIDAGNWNRNDVINYLHSQNVSQIDIVIGTHPDADHIGQLDKVLNTFEVGEVWLSGNMSTSQTFQRLLSAIDSTGVNYYEPRMGDEFEIGPLEIEVLNPKTISENDNEESISLKLAYGDIRFIFTGDASTKDELRMLQGGFNLQADILQLGHHGSSTSTHPSFLKEVNPDVAIYSAGLDNSYGHPHDEVVNLVLGSGVQLYGTDIHGTIIVSTDGSDYEVFTKKDGTISPTSNQETINSDAREVEQISKSESDQTNKNCIDLNSASLVQLQEIIHIGPARAEDLINLRPFSSIDDLSRLNGIGPARIADIKSQGLACIGG